MSSSSSKAGSKLPTSRIARPPSTAPSRPQSMQISGMRSNAQSPEPPLLPKTDTFIIGDRVWVSGTKPGKIAFLGETQFAEGDWAGVMLDDASGKNDGTVQGVRYFQCLPKRGIFTRLTNLRREPKPLRGPGGDNFSDGTASEAGSFVSPPTSITEEVGPHGDAAALSPAPSNNNNSGTTAAISFGLASTGDFRVGERVIVLSGSRTGTLRYLGATEFAKGCWAGVELDDPTGKNDGSVAGKRYFACKPNYGLFAPLHKIAKPGAVKASKPKALPGAALAKSGVRSSEPNLLNSVRMGLSVGQVRPVTAVPKFPRTSLSRIRSGSQESVSSVGSNFSSASRTRVKLGVTALNTNQRSNNNSTGKSTSGGSTPRRASTSQISAKGISVTALQKVLREKEEHIEQLLKERDMERAELVRASAQADKADARRSETEVDRDRLLAEYAARFEQAEAKLEEAERQRQDLQLKYDDEKRKVGELMFEMEEENIDKSTLETKTEEDESKIFELEESLSNEKERADVAEEKAKQLKELYEAEKRKAKEAEESAVMYLEQVESLQGRLSSNDQLQAKDRSQSDLFKTQLDEKDKRLREVTDRLEQLERQLKESQWNFSDLSEENVNLTKRRSNLEAQLEDMNVRLAEAEEQRCAAEAERKTASAKINAVEADLAAAEARVESLAAAKASLQAQVENANSAAAGSENELQAALARLREELSEKDDSLSAAEEARSRLDLRVHQLEAQLQEDGTRRQEELSGQARRFELQIQALQTKVEESEADVASLQSRLSHAAESHREALDAERAVGTTRTQELQRQLGTAEAELGATRAQLEEGRQREDEAVNRTEEVSREKSRLELSLRTAEADRAELIQAKRSAVEDRERLAANVLAAEEEMTAARANLESLTKEKDAALEEKIKAMKSQTELKARSDELLMRAECLQKEKADLETKVGVMEEELQKASASADAASQERIVALSTELAQANQCILELRQMNSRLESEHQSLVSEIGKLKSIMEEKTKLQRERDELQGMLKEMRTKYAHLESVNMRAQVQLSDVAEEMKKSRDQLINLTREHEALKGKHRMTLESKEKDRRRLDEKIRVLEQKIKDESTYDGRRSSSNTTDQQIDFLNSVIVELQQKNQGLQRDIEVLTGAAPDLHNNGHTSHRVPLPLRPYCDICEEFDLHDTEDCPRQMSSSDQCLAARNHHGERHASRPYCDTCEVFGHWTKDCDDDVTF